MNLLQHFISVLNVGIDGMLIKLGLTQREMNFAPLRGAGHWPAAGR